MKHRKSLVKILSLCAAIGMLVCQLATPIGAVAAEASEPFTGFTAVLDWDEVPAKDFAVTNGTTRSTALSPAGFGKAGKFIKMAAGTVTTTQIMCTLTEFSTADHGALAFWVSIPNTENVKNITLWIGDGAGNWGLTAKAPYHTVDANGVARTHTCLSAQTLTLTGGFSGWVIVPFSSLTKNSAAWSSPTVKTIILRPTHVADQNEEYLFDEFGMVSSVSDALAALTTNYTATTLLDWDTNKAKSFGGNEGASTATGNGVLGNGGIVNVPTTATGGVQVTMEPTATFTMKSTDAFSFWVSTPANGNKTLTIWVSDGAKNWGPQVGKPYYAVDENGIGREYMTTSDKAVLLPAGFTGWIVIPATTLYGGTTTLEETIFSKVMFRLPAPAEAEAYGFDEVGIVSSAQKLVNTYSTFAYKAAEDFTVTNSGINPYGKVWEKVATESYGNQLAVTVPAASTDAQIRITPKYAMNTTNEQALVFRVKLPSTGKSNSITLWCFDSDTSYRWQPVSGRPFYAVNADGVARTYKAGSGTVTLVDAFDGWVIVPFASLAKHNDSTAVFSDVELKVVAITPTKTATETDLVFGYDELGTVTSIDTAIAQLSTLAYTPVLDWDTTSITSRPNSGGTAVKEPSPSAYGNGYTVGKGNAGATAQLTMEVAMDTTGKEAAMFWISLPDTQTTTTMEVWFGDASGRWQLYSKFTKAAPYYLASENGTVQTGYASSNGVVTLPAKFSGWMVIPFTSLYHVSDGAEWDAGTPLTSLMLRSVDTDYYLDEIALVSSLNDTLDALSFVSYGTSYTWDTFYGTSGNQPKTNNDGLVAAVETSPSGYGQGVSLTAGASTKDTQFKWETTINTTASGSHAFWISVPADKGNKSITIWLADTVGGGNWGPRSSSAYYTVDAKTGTVANAAASGDKRITLNAGFTGWVILPYESFYKSATVTAWNAPTITNMMHVYSVKADVVETYHVDEVMFTEMTGEALAQRLSWQEKMMTATGGNQEYATVQRMRAAHEEIKANAAAGAQAVTDLTVLGNLNKTNATFIQARTTDNTLRFVLELDTRFLAYLQANYEDVEFGTLLAKQYTGEMEYSDITSGFSSTAASTIVRESEYTPDNITPINGVDNTLLYTCVVRKIPESNWETELRARSYVRFKGTDGIYRTVYGLTKTATYKMALAQ